MNMSSRAVTEQDLRAPAFREGEPSEYEFRADGQIVRKDRFARGIRDIVAILFGARYEYEIPHVIAEIHRLNGVRLYAAIDDAKFVYEDDPKALEVLDYLKAVIDNPKDLSLPEKD
jgi:hypothetical protein